MANRLRVFAVIGAVFSGVAALAAWALIGFNQHYFPEKSIVLQYVEVAAWSALALYLAMVAYFGSFKLRRRKRWSFAVLHLGVLTFIGGAIAGASGSKMLVLAIVGFVIAGLGGVGLARVRCPQCKARIGSILGPTGGPFSIPGNLRFCPFCGVELDAPMLGEQRSPAVDQRDR
jgi:hypothetical protein